MSFIVFLRRDAQRRCGRRRPRQVTASTTSSKKRAAVLDAAAVAVGALVGAILQELIDQIAVGAVHLDAVEPGGQRIARALRILRDDRGYLASFERARRRDRLEAFCREGLPLGLMAEGATGRRRPAGTTDERCVQRAKVAARSGRRRYAPPWSRISSLRSARRCGFQAWRCSPAPQARFASPPR